LGYKIHCKWEQSFCFYCMVNTLGSGCFRGIWRKTPKCMWLCAGISPLLYGLQTWSKRQKTWQVF